MQETRVTPLQELDKFMGGAWRLQAMQAIKAWLKDKLPTYTVIA